MQPALTLQELPFSTLRLQIIANERASDPSFTADDLSDLLESGVDVHDSFALTDGLYSLSRVYCLSIPHLLKLHPFIQGPTSCNDLAKAMATSLARELAGAPRLPPRLSPKKSLISTRQAWSIACPSSNGIAQNSLKNKRVAESGFGQV